MAVRVFLIKVSRQAMKNHNYLVVDRVTHQAVIVDPAWQIDKIGAALSSTRAMLGGILVTHAHRDSIELIRPLAQFYDVPIWMSQRDIEAFGLADGNVVAIDETPWHIGSMLVEPILTPGQGKGCVCYLIGNNAFTGDVRFGEGCDMCDGVQSAYDMFESLERLKARLNHDTRVFPGQTQLSPPGQRFGDVLGRNVYLHFPDKESFAAYCLQEGLSNSLLRTLS